MNLVLVGHTSSFLNIILLDTALLKFAYFELSERKYHHFSQCFGREVLLFPLAFINKLKEPLGQKWSFTFIIFLVSMGGNKSTFS